LRGRIGNGGRLGQGQKGKRFFLKKEAKTFASWLARNDSGQGC
jgi:hypothetical protein